MSLPNVHGTARLLTDPRKLVTGAGKPMASCLLLFVGWKKDADDKWVEGDAIVADAVAFEDPAFDLAKFAKGDTVEIVDAVVTGLSVWKDKPQMKIRVKECRPPAPRPGRGQAEVGTTSRQAVSS